MLNLFDRAPALHTALAFLVRVGSLADMMIHELGHAVVQLPFGTPLPSIKVASLNGDAATYPHPPILLTALPKWIDAPLAWCFRLLTLLSGHSASVLLGIVLLAAGLGREFSFTPLWGSVVAFAVLAALLMSTPLYGLGLPFAVVSTVLFIVCLVVPHEDVVTLSGSHFGLLLLTGVCLLLLMCSRSLRAFLLTFGFIGFVTVSFLLSAVVPFAWALVLLGLFLISSGVAVLFLETLETYRDPSRENDFSVATDEFGGHRLLWLAVFYVGLVVILINLIPALMTP